jgi:ribosome-associated protein
MEQADREQLRRAGASDDQVRQLVIDAARLVHDRHCEDVLIFDVRGLSDLTDYILVASGTSDVQIKAVGREVADLAEEGGFARYGHDVDDAHNWLALDFVDMMVHLFDPATRAHYDLEMMWDDAPRIDWRRTP